MKSIAHLFLNQPKISMLEYLDIEKKAEEKHEYHTGRVRPTSSKTFDHCRISVNLACTVENELRKNEKDCDVLTSLMKVSNANTSSIVYPDMTITRGREVEFFIPESTHVISNPVVLFEIISPSTRDYDYGEKFDIYKTFETFKEYVLIEQETCCVEVRTLENNSWTTKFYKNMNAVVELKSVGISIAVKEVYRRVRFGD